MGYPEEQTRRETQEKDRLTFYLKLWQAQEYSTQLVNMKPKVNFQL